MAGEGGERVVPVATERAANSQRELVELIAPLIDEEPGAIAKLRVVVVGESIAGAAGGAKGDTSEPPIDAVSAALSSAGTAMPLLASRGHLAPLAALGPLASLRPAGRSQPWQLSAPETSRSERRDAHRRTRRAKPRRRPVTFAQSQLFAHLDG
jgi:hypothetical protein